MDAVKSVVETELDSNKEENLKHFMFSMNRKKRREFIKKSKMSKEVVPKMTFEESMKQSEMIKNTYVNMLV